MNTTLLNTLMGVSEIDIHIHEEENIKPVLL